MTRGARWAITLISAGSGACGGVEPTPVGDRQELIVHAEPPGYTFSDSIEVSILSSRPAQVFYSTDGSDPAPGSPNALAYGAAIPLTEATLLSFIAIAEDGTWSEPVSELYVPARELEAPPVVPRSLVSDTDFYFFAPGPGSGPQDLRIELRSTGPLPVQISSIALGLNPRGWSFFETGAFELVDPPAQPLLLPSGDRLELLVRYHPSTSLRSAAIFIDSNDERGSGTLVIDLWGRALSD